MQTAIDLIQELDGTNPEVTIPWLDHIKSIMKKRGFDPVEVGMSKLKGSVLCTVNVTSMEGTLSYFLFCQLLIKQYSNILYVSDTLNAYVHLAQGEHKSIMQYISRAKVLLECIHNTSKMCKIPGVSYDKLYLVRGLYSPHAQQMVASEQDTWLSMEDIIQTMSKSPGLRNITGHSSTLTWKQ